MQDADLHPSRSLLWHLRASALYELVRMDAASIPETIRTIIDQAGGLGLRGAFTHIGAQDFRYRCAQADGEYRSGF